MLTLAASFAVFNAVLGQPVIIHIGLKQYGNNASFGFTSDRNFNHRDRPWDQTVFGTQQRLRLLGGFGVREICIGMAVLEGGTDSWTGKRFPSPFKSVPQSSSPRYRDFLNLR